jgi:hypothetical protein
MSHKTIAQIAIAMVVVFGATILIYPTLFNADRKGAPAVEAPPVPVQN